MGTKEGRIKEKIEKFGETGEGDRDREKRRIEIKNIYA